MNAPDFLGLRDEDLSPEERAKLASDLDLARAHRDALTLGRAIASLPPAATRPIRRAWVGSALLGLAGAGLSVAAALLLATSSDVPAPLRARGSAVGAADLALRAVAEGPRGVRALANGDAVAPDEAVVFEVHTSATGTWTLDERSTATRIWPSGEADPQPGGRHLVGGDRPQAWRPAQAGLQHYVATWCDAGDMCVEQPLVLRWMGP